MLTYLFSSFFFTVLCFTEKVRVPKVALVSYHKRPRSSSLLAFFFFLFAYLFFVFLACFGDVSLQRVIEGQLALRAPPSPRPRGQGCLPQSGGRAGVTRGRSAPPTPSLSPAASAGSRGTSGGRERNRQNGSETFAAAVPGGRQGPRGPGGGRKLRVDPRVRAPSREALGRSTSPGQAGTCGLRGGRFPSHSASLKPRLRPACPRFHPKCRRVASRPAARCPPSP